MFFNPVLLRCAVHVNSPGCHVKMQILTPYIWGEAWHSVFLTSCQGYAAATISWNIVGV